MKNAISAGMRFSYLTVLGRDAESARWKWIVRCDCGTVKSVAGGNLNNKIKPVRSCGCMSKELRTKANTKHGHAATVRHGHSRTYQSWMSMKERCDDTNHKSYADYGGRGIRYCEAWDEFIGFLRDMGERPKGMTLGRVDNGGIYEPANCRWETYKQQAANRRNSRRITHDGNTLIASHWADLKQIPRDTFLARLKSGWSEHDAITTPVRAMLPRGQTKRGNQFSKYHGR